MQAVAEQEAKLRAQQARDRRKSRFRAAPPPRFPQPPAPARSERPATRALTPKLAVETRSTARAAFDAMVAENQRKEEVNHRPQLSHSASASQTANVFAHALHAFVAIVLQPDHTSCTYHSVPRYCAKCYCFRCERAHLEIRSIQIARSVLV